MERKLTRDRYWEVMEWMTWMQSGIGPMQVSCLEPVPQSYEVNRLLERDKQTTSTATHQRKLATPSIVTKPR